MILLSPLDSVWFGAWVTPSYLPIWPTCLDNFVFGYLFWSYCNIRCLFECWVGPVGRSFPECIRELVSNLRACSCSPSSWLCFNFCIKSQVGRPQTSFSDSNWQCWTFRCCLLGESYYWKIRDEFGRSFWAAIDLGRNWYNRTTLATTTPIWCISCHFHWRWSCSYSGSTVLCTLRFRLRLRYCFWILRLLCLVGSRNALLCFLLSIEELCFFLVPMSCSCSSSRRF